MLDNTQREIDPRLDITMTLPAAAWHVIVSGLGKLPYELSAPIIRAIGQHISEATQPVASE